MPDNYVILPCNGLDKCAGVISGELAKRLHYIEGNHIICPVFFRVSEIKYKQLAREKPLLVIDGCPTRCASKLAAEKNLKISRKITITEEAKNHRIELTNKLNLQENEITFIEILLQELCEPAEKPASGFADTDLSCRFDYEVFQQGKFMFRTPKNAGVFFTENDSWVYVKGNRARVGVTDYVQQNLSDILFFTPPEIGAEIEQFGAVGEIESSKALIDIISPVSGKVVAVNEILVQKPELINENPYELGWVAELELSDFESDQELLLGFEPYFEKMKKAIERKNE